MKILDDLMASLDFSTAVKDIRQGIFHTGVMTRYCGLAATLPPQVKEPGLLMEKSPRELAALAYSESILEAAMGMATINSLLEVDEASCLELNAAEVIVEKGRGKNVAIVGHFPFIPRIRDHAKKLWVIEKNPKDDDFPEEEADTLIPLADVVAITGTALTNHTIEHLLDLCDKKAYVLMLNPQQALSWRQPGGKFQANQRGKAAYHDKMKPFRPSGPP